MSRRTKEQIINEKIITLKKTSIFSETDELILKEIALQLSEKEVNKGKLIFKKGSLGKCMYIIAKGMVRIHDQGHVYSKMGEGSVFGEYSLIDEETRSASVTAEKTTLLYKLEQDDFYTLISQKQEITKGVLNVLIKRIRNMNILEEKLSKNFLKLQSQKKEIEFQHLGISEKKTLLEIQNYDLLAINEEKNQQISILVHGMKNPLTSSLCMTDLLMSDTENLSETQKKYLEIVHSSSNRMNTLINDILNINLIESKTLRLKLEKLSIRQIIKEVADTLKYQAHQKQIILDLDLDFVEAKLNRIYLSQIIENLLSNAIKFTKPGESIQIKLYSENKKAIIEIIDHGQGIKAEDLPNLFEMYERQTYSDNKTPLEGLGLAIVKKYVNTMNGTVSCDSTYGQGAKFLISFDEFMN